MLISMRVERAWVVGAPPVVVADWGWNEEVPMEVRVAFPGAVRPHCFDRNILMIGMEYAYGGLEIGFEPIGETKVLMRFTPVQREPYSFLIDRADLRDFLVPTLEKVSPTEFAEDKALTIDWEADYEALKAGEFPSIETKQQ